MNERIKEMAMSIQRIKDMYEVGPVQRAAIEDFAELIINECVEMFADDLHSMRDYTGKACRYMIKDHFGMNDNDTRPSN